MSAAEREAQDLLRCLQAQRCHVLGIVEGLGDDALRRPVLPTGWSVFGTPATSTSRASSSTAAPS
jgi:hypothetical protein